jgi:hypothetical protein
MVAALESQGGRKKLECGHHTGSNQFVMQEPTEHRFGRARSAKVDVIEPSLHFFKLCLPRSFFISPHAQGSGTR